jgi:hypothetical protein
MTYDTAQIDIHPAHLAIVREILHKHVPHYAV